ncbi:MAG: hypothetical protein ACOYOF_17125 [Verrucomicrobiaceae bacterium]
MPFDPSLPLPNSPLESQVIRDQLQALFVLINNIVTVTAAQVDSTNTLPQGSPANVNVSVSGGTLHFSFDIPQGQEGLVGPAGPPFSTAVVDSVNTVEPGTPAAVNVSFDGTNVRFTFGIPRGSDGSNGSNGSDGAQGPPGEISQAQLNSAISGTSNNTNAVSTLDTGFADPDMEALRQKVNEMILNGRR